MSMDRYVFLCCVNYVFHCSLISGINLLCLFTSGALACLQLRSYFAIRHPIVFRQFFNKRVARCVILGIWVVAGLVFVPVLVVHHEESLKLQGEGLGK